MEINTFTIQKAELLQTSLQRVVISYDLYICIAAIVLNKIPRDVTASEREEAKKAVYKFSYSN